MNATKHIILITLFTVTIAVCFFIPQPKYESPDILSQLSIPYTLEDWRGRDAGTSIDTNDDLYKFISDVFARNYQSRYGENLLFLILDAGNFHHPRVCFSSSGYKIQELPDIKIKLSNTSPTAHVMFAEKGRDSMLVVYWMCIDKKQVDWTGQKLKHLWHSILQKPKVGLMVRLDIPTSKARTDNSLKLAQYFLRDIARKIPEEQASYIFGE